MIFILFDTSLICIFGYYCWESCVGVLLSLRSPFSSSFRSAIRTVFRNFMVFIPLEIEVVFGRFIIDWECLVVCSFHFLILFLPSLIEVKVLKSGKSRISPLNSEWFAPQKFVFRLCHKGHLIEKENLNKNSCIFFLNKLFHYWQYDP